MGAVELAPRGGQGDGDESSPAGQGARQWEPPGPSPGELHGDISVEWSPRPPQVPSEAKQQIGGSTARSGRDTGIAGGCICTGKQAWMLPPPQHPWSPFTTLGSVGRKETFPNTCPLGPPPSLAGGTHLCRVTVPLPAPPVLPGHLPRSWAELQSSWYHPLAVEAHLVPSLRLGTGPIPPLLGQFGASQRCSAVSFP